MPFRHDGPVTPAANSCACTIMAPRINCAIANFLILPPPLPPTTDALNSGAGSFPLSYKDALSGCGFTKRTFYDIRR